ncbi:hypothetical protein M513_13177 [Trichuris suis]|uniref:Uncharacterized protein n=1 Tax=Trichuris suis TaxID=68888 RepID=A0A085LLU3_9BILA|nr:hypothetical protein M513_13177 [Trichuris suis]
MKTCCPIPKSYIYKAIQGVYGTPLLSAARQLEHIRVKGALTKGQLTFLLKCTDDGMLLRANELKRTQNLDHNCKKILLAAGMSLLRNETRRHRATWGDYEQFTWAHWISSKDGYTEQSTKHWSSILTLPQKQFA